MEALICRALSVVTAEVEGSDEALFVSLDERYEDADDAGALLGEVAWQVAETYGDNRDAHEVILTELLMAWHREKMAYHTRRSIEIADKFVADEVARRETMEKAGVYKTEEAGATIKEAEAETA